MLTRRISLLSLALIPLLSLALRSQTSSPQPDNQLGIGIHTSGASVQYAITSDVHAGLLGRVNLFYQEGTLLTSLGIAPFMRLYFGETIRPFLEGGIEVMHASSDADFTTTSSLVLSAFGNVGIAHYLNSNLGFYAAAHLFRGQISPDPQSLSFGISDARIGVEWFFD